MYYIIYSKVKNYKIAVFMAIEKEEIAEWLRENGKKDIYEVKEYKIINN